MKEVKVAIVGSRSFSDKMYSKFIKKMINNFFDKHTEYKPIEVISGGAKGVDTYGEEWAIGNGIATNIIRPEWNKYGKAAGFIRNEDIIKQCDICLCFWDGESHGTAHDIKLCREHHKPISIWQPEFGTSMMFNCNENWEPTPIYVQTELPLTDIPTIGNYTNPCLISKGVYAKCADKFISFVIEQA